MSRSPIFRRITLTEVKKTSNKRGSLLRELASLVEEERDIIKNHHDPSYSNWRSSFLIEDGMTTDGFMQTQLKAEGDTDLATIEGNVASSYEAYEGGSDALSNTAITSSGTGSGSDGGFDLGEDYLGFNGNETPRYAALKPIDASKFDTIVVTGIRGNDNNGGEDPDETNEDLMVYYQLPGQNTIQRLDVDGGVTQSGIDYKIIPVGSDDSGLKEWSLTLPSYTRAANVRFILYQPSHHGTGFDNYGITQINYRRVKPISVMVSLDSPEASAFIRVGSPSKATESKKKREQQLREQLEAGKDYTDKKFGENFPGSEVAAPGEEDPTEVEKKAPGLGEFEPEVVDYNTWKKETKKEDPQAKTTEAEYQKYVDTIEREKSFAALRKDQQTDTAAELKSDPEGKLDFKNFKQTQIKKEVATLNKEIDKEMKDGDDTTALKDIEKVLKVNPDNGEAELKKATIERRQGDVKSADKDQSKGLTDYLKNPEWDLPEIETQAPSAIESQQRKDAEIIIKGLLDGDEELISKLEPGEQESYKNLIQTLKNEGGKVSQFVNTVATAGGTFADFLLHNAGVKNYTPDNPKVINLPKGDKEIIKTKINTYLNKNVDPKDWGNLPEKDLKAINNILNPKGSATPTNKYGPEGGIVRDEYKNTINNIGSPTAFAKHIKRTDNGKPYVDGIDDTYTFTDPKDALFPPADAAIRATTAVGSNNPFSDNVSGSDYQYTLNSGETIPIANMPVQVNFSDEKPNSFVSQVQQVINNPELLNKVSELSGMVEDEVKENLTSLLDNADQTIKDLTQTSSAIAGGVRDSVEQALHFSAYGIGFSNLLNAPLTLPGFVTSEKVKNEYGASLGINFFDGNRIHNGNKVQIPIVSTAQPYADENIVVNADGNVSVNDGTHKDTTGFVVFDHEGGGPLAQNGQVQLQVIVPPDGSEPYVLYTDHAYNNLDSNDPGEIAASAGDFMRKLAGAVNGLSNLIHGRKNGTENTGAMAGYPVGIRGDLITQTQIPLSSLPQESQEYIKNSALYQQTHSPQPVEYTGTPEQQENLYKDLNDLYDTDPDRFSEVMQEVQDNPEYVKAQDEYKAAEEKFKFDKEERKRIGNEWYDLKQLENMGGVYSNLLRSLDPSTKYGGDPIYGSYRTRYGAGTFAKDAEKIATLGGIDYKEVQKLQKDYALFDESKYKYTPPTKDASGSYTSVGVTADEKWAMDQKEYKAAKVEHDKNTKIKEAEWAEWEKAIRPVVELEKQLAHPTKKGVVTGTPTQMAEYNRLSALAKKALAKWEKASALYYDTQAPKLRQVYDKLVNERKDAEKKLKEMSKEADDNIKTLIKDLKSQMDELDKGGVLGKFDPDGELLNKQMQIFDKNLYNALNPTTPQDPDAAAKKLYFSGPSPMPWTYLSPEQKQSWRDKAAQGQTPPTLDRETGTPSPKTPPKLDRGGSDSLIPPQGYPDPRTDPNAYQDFDLSKKDSLDGTMVAGGSNRGLNRGKDYDVNTGELKGITTDSDFGKRIRDAVYGTGKMKVQTPQQDFGSIASLYGDQGVDAATLASVTSQTQTKKKKKKTTVTASYKPKGSMISERRKLKPPHDWFKDDDIKPEYPKDPPPEMVNNYHPDLVDSSKKAERFNKLDPASAKAMPKQDDPNIDAKVEKAKNNPDKDGPGWHKKVTDKIRMARAQG